MHSSDPSEGPDPDRSTRGSDPLGVRPGPSEPVPVAPSAGPTAKLTARGLEVAFASDAEFLACERQDLSRGRLFVPGDPPVGHGGAIKLLLNIPGRAQLELRATLAVAFGREDAARLGVPPGYVLLVPWPHRRNAWGQPAAPTKAVVTNSPVQVSRLPRTQRYRKRLPVSFGPPDAPPNVGFTTNLSATGLGVSSAHIQPAGTRLALTILSPENVPVRAQAVVAWAQRGVNGANGSMGIRLASADEAYYRLLLSVSGGAPTVAAPKGASVQTTISTSGGTPTGAGAAPGLARRGDATGAPGPEVRDDSHLVSQPRHAPVVLLVEDDQAVLDAMKDMLSEEGFVALTATNGIEAVRILDRMGPPSAIVVDLMMPVMSGWELINFLHVHHAKVPVIVVSAHGTAPGVSAFLPKPFDLDQLIRTVNSLAEEAAA